MILFKNAHIINEGTSFDGYVLVEGDRIESVGKGKFTESGNIDTVIDCTGKYLIPGVIDDQVHFRDPGLTHKGDIETESRAAVAGGVTSFMEMPNTSPQTITTERLEEKFKRASEVSYANYSFYLGATNDNIEELLKADKNRTCGIKVFMGSSTGNMLVNDRDALEKIFSQVKLPVAVHCEDEDTIRANTELYKQKFGEDLPVKYHPEIRSEEACYKSSAMAVELAKKFNTRLHILHLSTAKELELLSAGDVKEKNITAEVCVHHLWFDDTDYDKKGSLIRWNPAVKTTADKEALRQALNSDTIDVVATDHAPHTLEEKQNTYFKAMSGGPLVQHSLTAMFELVKQGIITKEKLVQKMSHAPAELFNVKDRGFIREGYKADLVLVDPDSAWTVSKDNIHYKCAWSPFEGTSFSTKVISTFVNGKEIYNNGVFNDTRAARALEFNR